MQHWVLAAFSVIFDSIFIAIAVGIFAYHHREYKPWSYILFGFFIRYFVILFFLAFSLYRHSLSSIIDSLLTLADQEDYILGALHLVFTIPASYAGISIGRDAEYLDGKDEELGYLAGCSKKLWVLLTLAYNPVVRLVTKFSIIQVYSLSKRVSSADYWDFSFSSLFFEEDNEGGIIGIVMSLMLLVLTWMLPCLLFFYGIRTIRDKEAAYRRAKIIGIFVIVPVSVLAIPQIRNKTFFF